jgi:putative hemolysin
MEILILLLLIVLNGVFAMSEMAVVSARKARLEQMAVEGNAGARSALELANAPNRFLSTIQIGITLIGVLAGAFGEATIAAQLADVLANLPALAAYSELIALAVVVTLITYLSLVIGELVPKRLALLNPERTASAIAAPMRALSRIASPLVYLLSVSMDAVIWLLGAQPSKEPPVTEEELRLLIRQGVQVGVLEESEEEMLTGVFRLSNRRVSGVMTPRTEIIWLDPEDSPVTIRDKIQSSGHTRFPVCEESLDHILGMVHVRDILVHTMHDTRVDLKTLVEPPVFVPESAPAAKLLEVFKSSGMPMAMVINEYGGLEGLVTIQDLLVEIVGEVELEEQQIARLKDGSWSLAGMLPIDEFKELFEIRKLPGEDKGQYQTLSGFVMMYLGRIPQVGDDFEWGGFHVEVLDMDGRRVDRVLVRTLVEPSTTD